MQRWIITPLINQPFRCFIILLCFVLLWGIIMLRLFLACLALCFSYNIALAKYCVKLPSCEELGYVFPYKESRRQIRCPFDTDKALYLDYCQAYGIQGKPDEVAGEYQECIEEKADGTKINTGYYRYTRCNVGYRYESGHCVRYSCNTPHTCLVGDVYLHDNEPIGVVFFDDGTTTKIVALSDVDENGEEGNDAYIAWSENRGYYYYYETGVMITTNASLAITDNDGRKNTDIILAYIKENNHIAQAATASNLYAPSICASDSFCGKGKWYLPALCELYTISENIIIIRSSFAKIPDGQIFTPTHYWSSTEYKQSEYNGAWLLNPYTEHYTWDGQWNKLHPMRPVLAF